MEMTKGAQRREEVEKARRGIMKGRRCREEQTTHDQFHFPICRRSATVISRWPVTQNQFVGPEDDEFSLFVFSFVLILTSLRI